MPSSVKSTGIGREESPSFRATCGLTEVMHQGVKRNTKLLSQTSRLGKNRIGEVVGWHTSLLTE